MNCFECDRPAQHHHHVVPRSKGGKRTLPLCRDCHALAHGIHGVTVGWGSGYSPELLDLVAEMYGDGWTLDQLSDFWHVAGIRPVRGQRINFHRSLQRRGVALRRRGRPRKVTP